MMSIVVLSEIPRLLLASVAEQDGLSPTYDSNHPAHLQKLARERFASRSMLVVRRRTFFLMVQ